MSANPPGPSDASEARESTDLRLVHAAGSERPVEAADSGAPGVSREIPESESDDSGEERRSGLPFWLFVLALVIFSGVVFWQIRRAGELEAQVVQLEEQLAETEALLEAHRSHLVEIRGGVHALSDRLGALQELVDREPASALQQAAPEITSPILE